MMSKSLSEELTTQSISHISLQILQEINNNNIGFVDEDGAYTSLEWQEIWECGEQKAQRRIKSLVTTNNMIAMKAPIRDVTGRKNYTFKYKMVTD